MAAVKAPVVHGVFSKGGGGTPQGSASQMITSTFPRTIHPSSCSISYRTAVLKFHLLEVVQINLGIVSGDQPLDLGRGEHVQPLGVNDAAEAANKSSRLLLNLRVHPEVSHEVDVADPAGKGGQRFSVVAEEISEACQLF